MKSLKSLFLAGLVLSLTSCSITFPVAVSDAKIGAKKGVSKTLAIGGYQKTLYSNSPQCNIYFNSKFGIKEAAQNGKITGPIATVDKKITNYIILHKIELIVTGE